MNHSIIKDIDEFINYQINDKSIPCISVTIVDKNNSLFKKVYNHKDIKTPIPTLDKSLFRVASVSKLFTYVGLLKLVDKNLISLDDPITKYIPNFSSKNPHFQYDDQDDEDHYKKITIFNLIRHTSGLIREPIEGNYFNETQCDLIKLVETMDKSNLITKPSKEYKYSNAAVAIAGYIIQVVCGITFEDYIEKEILVPLGMTSSSFKNINSETKVTDENKLHTAVGHMWRYWDETTNDLSVYTEAPLTHFGMNPACGLRTTINDIEKFLQFFLNQGEPLLKKSTFMQFISGQPLDKPIIVEDPFDYNPTYSHGIGIELNEMFNYLLARHGGAINGFASDFRVLPELGLGVFTVSTLDLCNSISQQVSEYLILQVAPKYLQSSHIPIKKYGKDSIEEKIKTRRNFLKNTMSAVDINDSLYDNIKGYWYLESNDEKDDYNDSNYMEILKSYNGTVYCKFSIQAKLRMLNSIDSDGKEITQIITSDRTSCNQILLSIPKDYNFKDYDSNPLKIFNFLVRDTFQAQHDLKYSKYEPLPTREEISIPPPEEPFKELCGMYLAKDHMALIFEDNGCLNINIEWIFISKMSFHSAQQSGSFSICKFLLSPKSIYNNEMVTIIMKDGTPTHLELSGIPFNYKMISTNQHQQGVYPIEKCKQVLEESLSIPFPFDSEVHKNHNLVDLSTISNTIKFDIKYASTDNFVGIKLYPEAKAFLNREAAESLLKAHNWLVDNWNVGIIVFDSYRPWNVTWAFSNSVAPEFRGLYVANPARGSVHNRGGALDISLYDLSNGKTIEMPGNFDEFSIRSHRSYIGGTSRQRWFKKLLTIALMNNNFKPYEFEWWHFDFKKQLPVLNLKFNEIK
ncbi:hypothetical protein DICPUDRAFT_159759 [Dictyostelium purpureum]|uniref:Beta-lactamase-related domain-containing protein n=1 Tax=Dictyostelium purpureum TaxID=5786 RepID=F1A4X7_DICPU|nr:uncharacterized protein DICPUDRAFT_159759 [Dictyostelium purpureum]EGC28754.1 hypothetical protein DICPUDRAFT_159759 [Dictyostelium purpureum]|eukprot:XP_003294722.1 hypothetical protein DICPUDRAFT_159759 [Dictyostelium purpureum]